MQLQVDISPLLQGADWAGKWMEGKKEELSNNSQHPQVIAGPAHILSPDP